MNPFWSGYKFWININVLVKNPLQWTISPDAFYTPPSPPSTYYLTAEGGVPILAEGGTNIAVEHT